MDHLGIQVQGITRMNLKVYASPENYRNCKIGFHAFHESGGECTIDQNEQLVATGDSRQNRHKQSVETKFVQQWLYFELLREVFCDIEYNYADFMTDVDHYQRRFLKTDRLKDLLHKWYDYECTHPEGRIQRLVRAQLALDRARHFVFNYCSVRNFQSKKFEVIWRIDDAVSLAILVLGETLSHALRKIQSEVAFEVQGWRPSDLSFEGWGYSRFVLNTFITNGWPAERVRALCGQFSNSTTGLLYALSSQPSSVNTEIHSAEHYSFYHHIQQDGFCQCKERTLVDGFEELDGDASDLVGIADAEQLPHIIRDDKIPLFRYIEGKLEIVPMSKAYDRPYTIFSHVWSDGFGNPETNQINRCVLDFFAELFRDIRTQRASSVIIEPPHTPDLFWIDTLAIPVGDEWQDERKKAIQQMHNIYRHAQYTVVLDKSLMGVPKDSSYTFSAMRISISAWVRRLWTLQEAVLSHNIYFYFNDTVYSLEGIEELFEEEEKSLHTSGPAFARTYFDSILGDERKRRLIFSTKKPTVGLVANVWKAVQWRTTAHPRHETLALATLFNLETDTFADASNSTSQLGNNALQERMVKLLDLLADVQPCPIPSGMIFLPGLHLSQKGYRWAPRTWLSACQIDYPDPLSIDYGPAKLIDGSGLEVLFPGFRLHEMAVLTSPAHKFTQVTPRCCPGFHFPIDRALHEWYAIEMADKPNQITHLEKLGDQKVAIICPRPVISQEPEIALLVAIRQERRGMVYVETMHRVWIRREMAQDKLEDCRSKFRKRTLGVHCVAEFLPEPQHWCVDGPERLKSDKPVKDWTTAFSVIRGINAFKWGLS
ncbi:hypothetical protein MMC10_001363 [Thelotrema lepadinum]|nr:hypothetical protein [Thelotrema lepadinum]